MAVPMIPPPGAPAFLKAHGWGGAQILPLAGDASFRRYFRIVDGDRSAVLMDAPPEHEDCRPFLAIADELARRGLSAPQALAVDLDQGLVLIEDYRDDRVNPLLARAPELERALYELAIDLLAELHRAPPPEGLAPYDEAVLRREVDLLTEYYAPSVEQTVDAEAFARIWSDAWRDVLAETAGDPVLVLRDYHADNLMWLPEREGVRSLGLLDFQDALAGHRAYDLVSLLQDARRDVDPALEQAMIDRYVAAAGIADAEGFRAAYELLGAQRNTKILGIFTRLWKRDGKPHYLAFQPRVWGYLERNLAHPSLAPLKDWFDAHLPPEKRAAARGNAA